MGEGSLSQDDIDALLTGSAPGGGAEAVNLQITEDYLSGLGVILE
ncbi:paraslipin, partial [Leptospira sarikeiensis]